MRELTLIAVGWAPTEAGGDALVLGELLARTVDAELLVVTVEPGPGTDDRHREGDELAGELARTLAGSSIRARSRVLTGGSVPKALLELAASEPALGMLVLGSSHRAGLGRVLPGGVAAHLFGRLPCSIAIAPRRYGDARAASSRPALAERPRVIEVAFDASNEARAALDLAAEIGAAAEATLRVIAVDSRSYPGTAEPRPETAPASAGASDLQSELHETVAALPSELRTLPIYERGAPVEVLLSHAEEGVDLLVTGSRGYGRLQAALLGTTSTAVISAAPCPVVVVPRPALGAANG